MKILLNILPHYHYHKSRLSSFLKKIFCYKSEFRFVVKKSLVFTGVIIALTTAAIPLYAWWDNEHRNIAELSDYSYHKILAKEGYLIKIISYSSPRADQHRNYFTHSDYQKRAFNAFNGSIQRYKENNFTQMAAQLGDVFHYIQDGGDPTKELDDLFHKGDYSRGNRARDRARKLLYKSDPNQQSSLETDKAYKATLLNERNYFAKTNDIKNVVRQLVNKRIIYHNAMKEIFKDPKRSAGAEGYIEPYLIKSVAAIVAAQERVIQLHYNEITKIKKRN